MTDPPPAWKTPWRRLSREVYQAVELRRELAELEIQHDRRLLRRGGLWMTLGIVAAIIGTGSLLQAAACSLATHTSWDVASWNMLLGAALSAPGIFVVFQTYRKTRHNLRVLRGTLAELHEDVIWLREWIDSSSHEIDQR